MTTPGEPMDAAQRESMEYWNGYYQGKAAALRNGEVVAAINARRPRRARPAGWTAVVVCYLPPGLVGAWLTLPGTLDHPSIWLHLAVGLVYGSWLGTVLPVWWRR